jgi:hypothetical protein
MYKSSKRVHTRGGFRYSIPTVRAFREACNTSFIRLYRSTRKLRVGPEDSRIIRNEGATGVNVNANKWVTCSAGASTR